MGRAGEQEVGARHEAGIGWAGGPRQEPGFAEFQGKALGHSEQRHDLISSSGKFPLAVQSGQPYTRAL